MTHTEFILGPDGELYFLEKAARVGGANIDKLVEAESGVDLWKEWARLELANLSKKAYKLKRPGKDNAGLLVCLSKEEFPDLSAFDDPEVFWKEGKEYHAAILIKAKSAKRVSELMKKYKKMLQSQVLAIAPPTETVVH